jgi:hypothetical protein
MLPLTDEFCMERNPGPLDGKWQSLAKDLLGEEDENQR